MGEKNLEDTLLTPVPFSKRQNNVAFLCFVPSPTNSDEAVFEGRTAYALRTRLETSLSEIAFNFACAEQLLTEEGTDAIKFRPRAVSKGRDGTITVHWWDPDEVRKAIETAVKAATDDESLFPKPRSKKPIKNRQSAATVTLISEWCKRHGFKLKVWSVYDLEHLDDEIEGLSQLVPYDNYAIKNPKTKHDLELHLATRRTWTIGGILQARKTQEEAYVLGAIASLVLDGTLYSDLRTHPLSKATEVSLYHPLPDVPAGGDHATGHAP